MFEKIWNRKTETTETKESLTLELSNLEERKEYMEEVMAEKILVITALSADPRNAKVQKIQEKAYTDIDKLLVQVVEEITKTEVAICKYY